MTKKQLAKQVSEQTGIHVTDVERMIDAMIKAVKQNVSRSNPVTLSGFGTFRAKLRQARAGQSIYWGVAVKIPAQYVPAFVPSDAFKREVKRRMKPEVTEE